MLHLAVFGGGSEMNGCRVVETTGDGRGGNTNCGELAEMLETHCGRFQV